MEAEMLDLDKKKPLRTEGHSSGIQYIEFPISYDEFFTKYLLPNRACILGPWITQGWKSRQLWATNNSQPNLDYIAEKFGDVIGPASNCNEEVLSVNPKENITVNEYIEYLKDYAESGYAKEKPCLYLKDWHFTKLFPDYEAYHTPVFFHSDWLNEFWDCAGNRGEEDDYRFVYIGPKGSWTPFHSDVLYSFSWSANIVGKKKWIILPPGEEDNLRDQFGNLIYDVSQIDESQYPHVSRIQHRYEIIQDTGEVIFIPSCWHHQVYNLEDTISINHNWINGCNIDICWAYLKSSLKDVQKQIEDCQGMEGWATQCQLILKANSGMNYTDMYVLLHTIAQKRLTLLKNINYLSKHSCEALQSTGNTISTQDTTETRASLKETNWESISKQEISDSKKNSTGTSTSMTKECSANASMQEIPGTSSNLQQITGSTSTKEITRTSVSIKGSTKTSASPKESTGTSASFYTIHNHKNKYDLGGVKHPSQPYYATLDHIRFDLAQILHVIHNMTQDPVFCSLDTQKFPENPALFMSLLKQVLSEVK